VIRYQPSRSFSSIPIIVLISLSLACGSGQHTGSTSPGTSTSGPGGGGGTAGGSSPTTTTLQTEVGNNTSAADSFAGGTNGNIRPGNVSKVPINALLYSGASTKIYAHYMPWFGSSSHMNVGYRSDDAAQVKKQVEDMVSRGIQGAIVDWYGPAATLQDTSTKLLMKEAEAHAGIDPEGVVAEPIHQLGHRFCLVENGGELFVRKPAVVHRGAAIPRILHVDVPGKQTVEFGDHGDPPEKSPIAP